MKTFTAKYVIIYANHIWESNNESEAIARLDSDSYILCSLVRDEQQLYSMVHPIIENKHIKERVSIFDGD